VKKATKKVHRNMEAPITQQQPTVLQLKMYSPLEVYMKELLRGFCGDCSLKDDNARLESMAHVASIIVGTANYPPTKDSLIAESRPTMCSPTDSNEELRGHDSTFHLLVTCECSQDLPESRKDNYVELNDEKATKQQHSLEQTRSQARSKDDMIMIPQLRSELGVDNPVSMPRVIKPNLRRASSLPIESGDMESTSQKQDFVDGGVVVHSTRSIMVKNDDASITSSSSSSSRKMRGVKVNWKDMNPSTNQGNRMYSNPRKLLDATSECAGSAPPSRPERKMSTEDDACTDPLSAQDTMDPSSERWLPANDKRTEKAFPMYNPSLVSCLAQEFQTRPSSGTNDRSIIDSVNDLWSVTKDMGQDVSSISLLSMAKSSTGPIARPSHTNDSGKTGISQGNANAQTFALDHVNPNPLS
jgi:hypothetical protein